MFKVFRLPADARNFNGGKWFVARVVRTVVSPDASVTQIFQLADGRILDMAEIAEGEFRRYARVPLYVRRGNAERACEGENAWWVARSASRNQDLPLAV
jgi:hypothetical protein